MNYFQALTQAAFERESKSPWLKFLVKTLFSFFIFVPFFFLSHSPVYGATRYVNADSNGAANNPTRPFNDSSYTPNDSYQTLTAAYNAASTGDTIELSGGTGGKSYLGPPSAIAKANLTIQGSSIPGYNGIVTIDYQGSGIYTIGINANNITINNLTISRNGGGTTQYALRIYSNNITVTNVTIKNSTGPGIYVDTATVGTVFNNCFFDLDTILNDVALKTASSITVNNCIFTGGNNPTNGVGGITLSSYSGTSTFNNVLINGSGSQAIGLNSGSIANLNNCVITNPGINSAQSIYFTTNGGIINTNNCLIQGPGRSPNVITSGTGTGIWNSNNDIINGFPYYIKTKANIGFIALSTDDRTNINYCATIANYAMAQYGIPYTCYVNDTKNLTANDISTLQELYKQGDEIGVHTRHHTPLSLTYPFTVNYSGSGKSMVFVVSSSGTSLSMTGTADTHGPIDLTASPNNTVGGICKTIAGWTHYTCTLSNDGSGNTTSTSVLSNSLKDASTSLNGATNIPYDDDTGPNNRLYKEEITNSINDLETAIDKDPGSSSYYAQTLAFPYNDANTQVLNWIKANTRLIGVRSNYKVGTGAERYYLGSINIFNAYYPPNVDNLKGSNYSSLSSAQQQIRIQQAARSLATFASNGYFTGFLSHSTADLTAQEFQWLIDELVKYRPKYNLQIDTFANLINEIRTSGNWTDSGPSSNGGEIYTRIFTGNDDFRLTSHSPLINAGTTVAGRTTDYLGNSLVGIPDIGPYEFQAPAAPISLAQYKSDGTTAISAGDWTNQTSAIFKFSMSSTNTSDSLTPYVNIQTNATPFTNNMTNSGNAVAYSGFPVTGSVTVSGLTDGTIYHWQASASNSANIGSWVTKGGDPDFGVDITAPTTSNNNDASWHNSNVTITLRCSDSGSLCANTYYTFDGSTPTTGSYSGNSIILSSGGSYTIKYYSVDNAGNSESVKTTTIQVKIDKTGRKEFHK